MSDSDDAEFMFIVIAISALIISSSSIETNRSTEIGEGHLAYYKEKEERGGEGCKSSLEKIVCKTLDSTFIHHEIERVDF